MIQAILIEEMTDEHKEAVQQLLVESYAQYKHSVEDEEFWNLYVQGMVDSVNSPYVDRILVAKDGEEIIGTVQLFENAKNSYEGMGMEISITDPFIRLLAVHPKARGKGIARELLEACLLYGKEKNADSVYLFTGEIMEKAIQLYERFGFKRDSRHEFENAGSYTRCYRYDL
jgi:GNAT superfamily N-acetyltransferase